MNNFRVYLAPMEGLADAPLRKILCAHGSYDECFSEFIRVTDIPLAEKTLARIVTESENGFKTADGTPVRVQLLGDNPDVLAKSAKVAERMGAHGVDMNFGCPSRFVHHAGSMLLRETELLNTIVSSMRDSLDPNTTFSVKIRAGFADKKELADIIKAVAVEGVNEIIVHCRTRSELYRSEALDWSILAPMHELCPNIELVANGDIVDLKSALECRKQSLCSTLMCGRGAFMTPNLGKVIKNEAVPFNDAQILTTTLEVMEEFISLGRPEKTVMDRAKQFLGYARLAHRDLAEFFRGFCRLASPDEGMSALENKLQELENLK